MVRETLQPAFDNRDGTREQTISAIVTTGFTHDVPLRGSVCRLLKGWRCRVGAIERASKLVRLLRPCDGPLSYHAVERANHGSWRPISRIFGNSLDQQRAAGDNT